MPRFPEQVDRNAAILEARLQGESLRAIAQRYGVSVPRIRQILAREIARMVRPRYDGPGHIPAEAWQAADAPPAGEPHAQD